MRASDSLWPVVLLTTLVLGSGSAIEAYARSHEAEAVVIAVSDEAAPSVEPDGPDEADRDDPDTMAVVSETHAQARALARRGELEPALELLARITTELPQALGPKLDLAYWLRQSGRLSDSLSVLEQAVASAPASATVHFQLALTQKAAGQLERAESTLRRALELKPGHGRSLLTLAALLKKRGAAQEGLTLLERAAASGSNVERASAGVALGRARLAVGQRDRALSAFRAAIDYAPSDPSIRLAVAKACVSSGDRSLLTEARQHAERAALLAPDRALVVALLGWVRERSGDLEGARAAYTRALQVDPSLDYAERKLLHLDLAAQDLRSAHRHAEHLVSRFPEVPEHHFLLALVTSREGMLDGARTHYLNAIAKANGAYPEAYFNLGRLEKAAGKPDAALSAYKKAIELRPRYPEAWNNLGLVLLASGKPEEARAAWSQALQVESRYAPAWVNLGELAAASRAFSEAEASFAKALELRPRLASALLGLARLKRDSGRVADAISRYRDLLKVQPRSARAWFELSELLEREADLRGAAEAALKASELTPDAADFRFKRADMLAKLGELKAARAAYEELIDRDPGHHGGRLGLAELLHRLGDDDGCQREAKRALEAKLGSERARGLVQLCSKT